jgi:hypothetical protein
MKDYISITTIEFVNFATEDVILAQDQKKPIVLNKSNQLLVLKDNSMMKTKKDVNSVTSDV